MIIGHLQVLAVLFASFESFEWPPVFLNIYSTVAQAFDVNLSFALCPAPEDNPRCSQLYPLSNSWILTFPWLLGFVFGCWYLAQVNGGFRACLTCGRAEKKKMKKERADGAVAPSDGSGGGGGGGGGGSAPGPSNDLLALVDRAGQRDAAAMRRRALFGAADTVTRTIVTLLFFVYIPVMKAALTPFDCFEAVEGEGRVMESNPLLRCTLNPSKASEADYVEIAGVAATVLVAVGVGFPLFYVLKLYRARKEGRMYSGAFKRRVGDMHVHFAEDQWYWNMILFAKKFGIAWIALPVVIPRRTLFQIECAALPQLRPGVSFLLSAPRFFDRFTSKSPQTQPVKIPQNTSFHYLRLNALHCTATARILILAQCSAIP